MERLKEIGAIVVVCYVETIYAVIVLIPKERDATVAFCYVVSRNNVVRRRIEVDPKFRAVDVCVSDCYVT